MTKTTLRDYARTLATRPSALRLSERGIDTSNAFAGETLTNLRIQHIGYDAFFGEDGEPAHWALDGVNMNADPVELSEDIRFFRSHAEAVADIPDFLAENGYVLVPALDPLPFRHYTGIRHRVSKVGSDHLMFRPRPGYSQTREDYTS